jgi:hypothetical protein
MLRGENLKSVDDVSSNLKSLWQGWSLVLEGGIHFKTLPGVDFSQVDLGSFGHKKNFWGELGVSSALGFKYARTFFTHGYWDIKVLWTFFYPDPRLMPGARSDITLSNIPLIGQYINFGEAPGWVSMLLPMLYFDIGYITKKGYLFTIGSVYLWGLSPAVAIPFDEHWSMEFRTTIFLDRLIAGIGYHTMMSGVGISYKF